MSDVPTALWRDMMGQLRSQHGAICRQWFDNLEPVELDAGLLVIHTDNAVQRNYLEKRCLAQFTEAAQAATGNLVGVRFVDGEGYTPRGGTAVAELAEEPLTPAGATSGLAVSAPAAPRRVPSQPLTIGGEGPFEQTVISPDYAFDTFVVGPENHLAYSAAVAVANQPGTTYNPLFIHGGVGLGKTHLLQAICQAMLKANPDSRIVYLSCDAFVNQFLECVQRGEMSEFRHRYRHVDLLVIDDIHFLANRERTQEEFFHTFNELYQLNKQIVVSSDSPPHEIPQLEARLVSRFQWGLVAPVAKFTYETREAILRGKATIRGMEVPDDVISYLATKINSNARELEGAVVTLQGYAAIAKRPIDMALAQQAWGDSGRDDRPSEITLQNVIDAVIAFYNVRLSDLQSKRRHKSITMPRQVCMWLARKNTRFSLEEIGGYFGGRDHTTVMHALKIVEARMEEDPAFARLIEELKSRLSNGQPVEAAS